MIFLDLVSPDARFVAAPIPHKDEILAYMKRGRIIAVSPGFKTDIFTGERIKGSYTVLSDGVYAWGSDAVYRFEKYNLELPSDFIEYAMKNKSASIRSAIIRSCEENGMSDLLKKFK